MTYRARTELNKYAALRSDATAGSKTRILAASTASLPQASDFDRVLEVINGGHPIVFVLGRAGTGKSTLIRKLLERDENQVVLAPTGIAAINIGGQTIHSFFNIPPRLHNHDDILIKRNRLRFFRNLKRIIIDEMSMVRADVLDSVDYALRINRQTQKPFGGVQMVFVGDFFQLPPVLRRDEKPILEQRGYQTPYALSAQCLASASVSMIELKKVHRQNDAEFKKWLGSIRSGTNLEKTCEQLNAHCLGEHKRSVPPVLLTATNETADKYNYKHLMELPGEPTTYEGIVQGDFNIEKDKWPAPECLALKVGARIMMLKNDKEQRWINGTLGTVARLERDKILVTIDGENREFEVTRSSWENIRYELNSKNRIEAKTVGTYEQFPILPAWAITIHKSQGMTLENVRIDLGKGAFAPGQTYVALSRARSLEGLSFAGRLRVNDIIVDARIATLIEGLKRESDKAK